MENKLIALKILKVMAAVKSISKEGFNAFHKYKYVTDAAIVSKIRAEMIKNNLVCFPNQIGCTVAGDITTVLVEYTLLDADSGEFIVSRVYGQGQDKGDKGVYKGSTGAEKYFLLKTFLIPTDDDPENDAKDIKREESKGRNIGVRVPAGYWTLRDKDPQAALELLGGEGYFPLKTIKGYYIGTNKPESEDKAFVDGLGDKKVLIGAPEINPYISELERAELFRLLKEKGIHHLTFKKALKDEFHVEGTDKIRSNQYAKVTEWLITHDSAAVGA